MLTLDKKEFAFMTCELLALLNQPAPTKELLGEWWAELEKYELKDLRRAYDTIADLKAMPTLKAVLQWIKPIVAELQQGQYQLKGDGRDWARKILNSPKNREPIAIKNAKIALGIN